MNKNRLCTLACVTLLVLTLGVSASGVYSQEDQVVLHILHNWSADDQKGLVQQAIFEAFMEEHPNIRIEEEVITDEVALVTRVETAFLGGEEPDIIFYNYLGPSLEWIENGLAVPVNDYIEDWGLRNGFLEAALEQYTDAQGNLVAFPLEGYNWPIWYNMAILEAAGIEEIPTTYEDLLAAIPAIREAGYEPFVVGGADWTGAQLFQMMLMSHLEEEDIVELFGAGGFAGNPNAVAFANNFVELRDAGLFAENVEGLDFATMNEKFFAGEAAMMHGGSWSYAELPEEMQDDVILAGMPIPAESPYELPVWWSAYYAKGVWITRNGQENLDAVEAFVTFYFQPENIALLVEQGTIVPPLQDLDVNEDALNPLFVQSLNLVNDVTFLHPVEPTIPASLWNEWERVTGLAYLNGTSSGEIIRLLDEAYEMLR